MAKEGFFSRLKHAGLIRIFFGYDFILAFILTICVYFLDYDGLENFNSQTFIEQSTSLAISLTGFIIAGIAIIIALTDEEFLVYLKKEGVYNNLLFVFEYTVLLAIFVSFVGISFQSYDHGVTEFYSFLFLFLYLLFAASRLISNIISFGDRKGDVELIDELSEVASEVKASSDKEERGETESDDD